MNKILEIVLFIILFIVIIAFFSGSAYMFVKCWDIPIQDKLLKARIDIFKYSRESNNNNRFI